MEVASGAPTSVAGELAGLEACRLAGMFVICSGRHSCCVVDLPAAEKNRSLPCAHGALAPQHSRPGLQQLGSASRARGRVLCRVWPMAPWPGEAPGPPNTKCIECLPSLGGWGCRPPDTLPYCRGLSLLRPPCWGAAAAQTPPDSGGLPRPRPLAGGLPPPDLRSGSEEN